MDFTNYPNILALADKLGGIKKTVLNKKLMEKAEQTWAQLTPEEIAQIEGEAASASQMLRSFIMPTAILKMNRGEHALSAIPVRDIVWVYGNVVTNRVNFIPVTKEHSVEVMTRSGDTYVLGTVSTPAFTKKDVCGNCVQQIQEILEPYRKGIIYGWSEEIMGLVSRDFQAVVQMMDSKSSGQ